MLHPRGYLENNAVHPTVALALEKNLGKDNLCDAQIILMSQCTDK